MVVIYKSGLTLRVPKRKINKSRDPELHPQRLQAPRLKKEKRRRAEDEERWERRMRREERGWGEVIRLDLKRTASEKGDFKMAWNKSKKKQALKSQT